MIRFITIVTLFLLPLLTVAQKVQQKGKASFYANTFEGRLTANGETFSNNKMTAAHRTLPFGTQVIVTNLSNKRNVLVTINDRGPFIKGRIIDLSQKAAKELGFYLEGITEVSIDIAHQTIPKGALLQPLTPISIETIRIHSCYNINTRTLKNQVP